MFDPVSFLSAYDVDTSTEGPNTQEGWISFQCPVCDDHSNHGAFNIEGGYYYCWRCGSSSVAWIIQQLLGVPYGKAKEIQEQYDLEVDYEEVAAKKAERLSSPNRPKTSLTVPGGPLGERHREYLRGRRYDPDDMIRKYGLLGTGYFGDLAHRVVIPIFYKGQLVSWQARSILKDNDLRYLTCPKEQQLIDSKKILYNLDNCPTRRVIVVEGVFDAWRFGDCCCATFGTTATDRQALEIVDRFDSVFLMFDDEPEAQERATDWGFKIATLGVEAEVINLGKEPDDLTIEEVYEIRSTLRV